MANVQNLLHQFVTFSLGREGFGVDVAKAREILDSVQTRPAGPES